MNNNYWSFSFEGDWSDANSLSINLGAPDAFTPAAIAQMPSAVGRGGARDALIWRMHHWGFAEGPTRLRWSRRANGRYVLNATGGRGAPTELVRLLAKTHKNLSFRLVWLTDHGFQGGEDWQNGQRSAIPDAEQDRVLFEEFRLAPQAVPF